MDTTPKNTMTTNRVLLESKRIILANYTHFVTLALFFLPLSFSLITNQVFTVYQEPRVHHILYMLVVNIFTLCSTAMITYSTYHAFFGEELTFLASLRSLTSSFLPLFWTAIVMNVLLFLITLIFLMFVGVILMLVQILGFVVIDYNSIWFPVVIAVVLVVIMLYFQIAWSLAFVVVVVESNWGFAALRRSLYLVKGMRSVSLLILMYFGIFGGLMAWIGSANVYEISGGMFVFITMLGTFFTMMILLHSTAANVVLYIYCKVLHGELPIEAAQGIADHEYISLPYDYEKVVPHDVTVYGA